MRIIVEDSSEQLNWEWHPELHIEKWRIRTFLDAILSGLLCHIYCMVNQLGTDDTIASNLNGNINTVSRSLNGADTGRWLTGIVELLGHWYRTSWVSGCIIILCMAAMALLVIDILRIRSRAGRILTAVLLEASPVTQAYMILYEIGYPISALLCVWSVWFLACAGGGRGIGTGRTSSGPSVEDGREAGSLWKSRKGKNIVAAAVLQSAALVIFPANISVTLTLILLVMFRMLCEKDALPEKGNRTGDGNGDAVRNTGEDGGRRWKIMGNFFLRGILVAVIGGAFLLVSSKMLMTVRGLSSTTYQGASQAMSGGFVSSLGLNYIQSIKKFIVMGLWKIQTIPFFRFTFYICYLLDIICVILLLKHSPEKGRGLRLLTALIGVLFVPVCICTMTILSYGFMYRGQHRVAFQIFIIGTIMLAEMAAERLSDSREEQLPARSVERQTERDQGKPTKAVKGEKTDVGKGPAKGRVLLGIACVNLILMAYGSFLYDNVGYANQHHVISQDKSLCTRILASLDRTEGFSYDQPVYFLNITSWDGNESPTPMKYDPDLYTVIWPVATTDLYCWGDESIRGHIYNYEGVELKSPSEAEQESIERSALVDKYENLQSGDFAVEKMDGIWVVVVKTVMPPNVLYG